MLLYIDMKNYKNIACTDFVNVNSLNLHSYEENYIFILEFMKTMNICCCSLNQKIWDFYLLSHQDHTHALHNIGHCYLIFSQNNIFFLIPTLVHFWVWKEIHQFRNYTSCIFQSLANKYVNFESLLEVYLWFRKQIHKLRKLMSDILLN